MISKIAMFLMAVELCPTCCAERAQQGRLSHLARRDAAPTAQQDPDDRSWPLGTTPAAARAALQQLQRARRARVEDQKHRSLPDVQVRMQVGQEQERRSTDTGGRLSTPKACPDDVHLAATSSGHCCSHWLANRAQCSPIIF